MSAGPTSSGPVSTGLATLCLACVFAPIVLSTTTATATEGQWKPGQIAEVQPRAADAGLELDAKALWDPDGDERTGGLIRASVNIGGCSAAFVSAEGLIATNHHCAYGALQANSTVEHDYLEDGFLAKTRAEELPAEGKSVRILRSVRDVTQEVRAKLDAAGDDLARAHAYDMVRNELVDACEAGPETEGSTETETETEPDPDPDPETETPSFRHCELASFFGSSLFELHEYVELRDLRLVYAPPSAIGEYGGETDNWMWPRHTGDFSLLRAYAGPDNQPAAHDPANKPYVPGQWLVPSTEGVNPGDFAAILGYPGKTERYLWGAELARHHQQWLPMRVEIYGEWIEILEGAKQRDEAVGIKVAAFKKSLANRHKNAAGKIDGLDRLNFADTRRQEDARLAADEAAKPTLDGLEAISAARRERGARQFLLDNLRYAPRSLAIARKLATWAEQRAKIDVERANGYRDRDRERVWTSLEQLTKDYDPQVDVELLASFLAYADRLEDGQRIAGFDAIMGEARGSGGMPTMRRDGVEGPPEAYLVAARAALDGTALADAESLRAMFDDPKAVTRSNDPMLALARALDADSDALGRVKNAERGRLLELEPRYFELISKLRSAQLYSDANRTLRMSFATVQGYDKWSGETQAAQTVLAGAVAKHQGAGEFDLPDAVLAKAKSASESRWIDPELGDVPIAFLTDGDTTGGNSGSPVIDARGRLIGFNFDRVWENVAGDYVWRMSQSRNISADVRYLYWMLDEVEGATHLLTELGVADYQPPPPPAAEAQSAAPDAAAAPGSAPAGCNCALAPERGPGLGLSLLGLIGLLGLGLSSRRRD